MRVGSESTRTSPGGAKAAVENVAAGLLRRLQARHEKVELVETHISWVLLAGHHAYKIKKPVRFGFLDFSTLEARRHFCAEELRLNRRLAPALYLGVVPIRDAGRGPSLAGSGPIVDHAVKMRRLPPHSLASEWLARGALDLTHLRRLAGRLEAFHRSAPAATAGSGYGSFERIRGDALRAVDALARLLPAEPGAAGCATLRRWFEERSAALAPRFAARVEAGRVREGHGDLHLDNILVLGRDVTAFDCVEFDPALRWIDVMNDVAFLIMDLLAHRRRDLAFGFLDAYLEAGGDFDGLDVLRLYLVYRAIVRALVSALRERARVSATGLHADEYLQLALRLAAPDQARLLLTHGLPGAGKTHLTQQLLERAGAIRIRSDVERKRLAGLSAGARSRASTDLYTPERNAATYERLAELARASLRSGYPTIVDAAFLRRQERDRLRAVAVDLGLPCALLDCQAPMATLRERVRARSALGQDASEADLAVLERLAQAREPLTDEERTRTLEVRTDQPVSLAALLARWLALPGLAGIDASEIVPPSGGQGSRGAGASPCMAEPQGAAESARGTATAPPASHHVD